MRKNSCSGLCHVLPYWAIVDNLTSLWETKAEVKCYNEHKLNHVQTERPLWLPICDLLVLHYVC